MIFRRALPLLLATPVMAQPSGDYRWRVMRNGSAIGTQNVSFTQRGAERVALTETLIAPTVMGIVVYRYEHRYTEVTRGERFVSVRSRLTRNGRITDVEADATAQGVALRGPEGALQLPPDAAPLSWWEPQRFASAAPIFGTTTGKLMDLRRTREALPAGGVRWRITGEVDATLEFTAAGRWSAYQVKGDDGSVLIYEAA